MDKDEQIRKGLKKLTVVPEGIFIANVTAIDKVTDTINIEDLNGLDYEGVRLKSVIDGKDDVVKYPAIKSSVLVASVGNDENTLFVIGFSEIESIKGVIGLTGFEINKEGYSIARNGDSLKKVLNEFIDEVNKIVVVQGTTINVVATNALKLRLNKILK